MRRKAYPPYSWLASQPTSSGWCKAPACSTLMASAGLTMCVPTWRGVGWRRSGACRVRCGVDRPLRCPAYQPTNASLKAVVLSVRPVLQLTGPVGTRSFRRYLPSSATTLSSMVLVQTYTSFVDNVPKVRDDVFRWNAGNADFTHIATAPYWRASSQGVVSTTSAASNGGVVYVYTRETVTEFSIPHVAVYGAIWGPNGASQQSIDPVTCITDDASNTDKPCTVWSLVAQPSGAVLLAQNGLYYLA